jgi:hypothetical protein
VIGGERPRKTRAKALARYVRNGLTRYRLFQVSAKILEDVLLTLLDFEQDRLRHASVVVPRMDLARLQKDPPQIVDALLRKQHLVVGLNHGSSSSQYRIFESFWRF